MADKFHINPKTGNPSECHALVKCPFGGEDEHYDSITQARAAFEESQGSQIPSPSNPTVKGEPQRLIDGNWVEASEKARKVTAEEMTRHEIQLHALSVISHNMSPAIGMFRLVADSGDEVKIERSLKAKDNYVATAAEGIADKLEGDREKNIEFLTQSIREAFDPIFANYAKDVYANVNLDLTLDDFAIKIADYSKKL